MAGGATIGPTPVDRAGVPTPARRILRAFAFDPMSTRLSGRFLSVDIRFEDKLAPGPAGELLQVIDFDPVRGTWYRPVDLDDRFILAQQGLRPSESDPRTHQQIVYALAMSVIERFERFSGRRFRWKGKDRLKLVPHAFDGRNAYFDPARDAVLFGYYRASSKEPGANLPGQLMFTCLSVDIIAHEVTHAIVHRLRPKYQTATNRDVFAWHEAFADLVALFHHFLFPEVVADAIAGSHGDLSNATALFELASEFGVATGRGKALRSAIGSERTPTAFINATEPHERGACFVAAVFDAYLDTYKASIAGLRRLATGGSGVLPPGALPPDLVVLATREAVRHADRILGMVVRAFEFLPVVDVTFGDVVQAIVTADRVLFPDDQLRFRATLVEALRRRGIHPDGVTSLADEALLWESPVGLSLTTGSGAADLSMLVMDATLSLDITSASDFEPARQEGAPNGEAALLGDAALLGEAAPNPQSEKGRPGRAIAVSLHRWATHNALAIGLDPDHPIQVSGYHVAYLQAADGQPRPVVVVQLLQRRPDVEDPVARGQQPVQLHAGTTIIAKVSGEVEYVVAKPLPLSDPDRLAERAARAGIPESVARRWHDKGRRRLEDLRDWFELTETEDAFAPWTNQPAVQRMTFAQFHAAEAEAE